MHIIRLHRVAEGAGGVRSGRQRGLEHSRMELDQPASAQCRQVRGRPIQF